MKFSIVIPTRNRLDLLKYAVASVLQQNYTDWELVISDNASDEDIAGFVSSLNEPRIKYSRTENYLSITENWNRSVDLSSGEYVIMIGDDDILLKNHLQIAHNLIEKFEKPDLIYTNAYLYAYPGVIPSFPDGVFQPFGSLYGMPKQDVPFWLDQSYKKEIVQATLEFRAIYSTNMQHALISRPLLEKVKREGKLFLSSYPDIYAMSALFLEAERLLIYPNELVVIGISSKSHGYYAINGKDDEAIQFLNAKKEMSEITSLKSIILPGFIVDTYWLGAIELFKNHFAFEKLGLNLDYNIYRRLQINHIRNKFLQNRSEFEPQFKELMKHLRFSEKAPFLYSDTFPGFSRFVKRGCNFLKRHLLRLLPPTLFKPSSVPQTSYTPLNPPPAYLIPDKEPNRYATILEIYEQVEPIDCTQ